MTEEKSARQQAKEDLFGDLRRTSYVFIPLIVSGLLALAFKSASLSVFTTYLIWALACLISGAAVGFLFGIPKILQADKPPDAAQVSNTYRQQVNTNLEQISDWLTKIIVGLGLINLTKIPPYLNSMAGLLASSTLDNGNPAFAMALIVYFSLLGFLSGYVTTRLFLAGAFSKADQLAAAIREAKSQGAEQTVNELRALSKEVEPKLFSQLVNQIEPEKLVGVDASAVTKALKRRRGAPAEEAEETDSDQNESQKLDSELAELKQKGIR